MTIAEESGVDAFLIEAQVGAADAAARIGRDDDAVRWLDRAAPLAKTIGNVSSQVVIACLRAALPGGDAAAAFEAFRVDDARLTVLDKFRCRAALWRATRSAEHLSDAWRILAAMRENAPPEYRETIVANVPLHREVAQAWKARGGA